MEDPHIMTRNQGKIHRSRWLGPAALLLALLFGAYPAHSLTISIEFFGSVDIASYRTYSWVEGVPAPNFAVEQTIHGAVDEQLQRKGLRRITDGEPDCYVVTKALRDRMFDIGLLWVEVYDGRSKKLVWRGKAGEVASNDLKKIQKTARKAIKKLFKGFPVDGR